MADNGDESPPPSNVMHGALRYYRSQAHLLGRDRTGTRGGRDDVGAFENELWRGRAERMRAMHAGGTTGSGGASREEQQGRRPSSNDERLRREVHELLTVHNRIDASEIEVAVDDGIVTLRGRVGTPDERRLSEDESYRVRGVVNVVNQLSVPPRSVSPPAR